MTDEVKNKDRILVGRARQGDRTAFEGLIDLYQDRVYNLSFRLTGQEAKAWDLSQEAFMRAFKAIKDFKGESSFYTWIYRIVLNLHLNQEQSLQGKMEKRALSINYSKEENGRPILQEAISNRSVGNPSEETLRKEREQAVQAGIAALPANYRQVVLLRDMEGLSYEEIADMLSLPVGTVRSRLHRAREELKQRLKGVL